MGHVLLLICTIFYLPYWATFHFRAGAHWYTRAFLGAILSYGVVVYKSFPVSLETSLAKLPALSRLVLSDPRPRLPFFFLIWEATTTFRADNRHPASGIHLGYSTTGTSDWGQQKKRYFRNGCKDRGTKIVEPKSHNDLDFWSGSWSTALIIAG